jgi:hypothetical protein
VHHIHRLGFLLGNAAHWGRRKQQEESMFKMTKDDLARKSNAQLLGLFNQVSLGLRVLNAKRSLAQSLLVLIQQEIAKRGPAP